MDGLGRRVLVAAFDGWNDAGEAASSAIAHLRDSGKYETVFSVDPELYFDYQYTRPQVAIDGEGKRTLRWPEATLLKPVRQTRGTQLWLLTGVEPARSWQAFATEFIDVALREDITGMVSIGSMMSWTPIRTPASWKMRAESSRPSPTRPSACSCDQVPPKLSTRGVSAAIQYGSVSTRVPSMSHRTAASGG